MSGFLPEATRRLMEDARHDITQSSQRPSVRRPEGGSSDFTKLSLMKQQLLTAASNPELSEKEFSWLAGEMESIAHAQGASEALSEDQLSQTYPNSIERCYGGDVKKLVASDKEALQAHIQQFYADYNQYIQPGYDLAFVPYEGNLIDGLTWHPTGTIDEHKKLYNDLKTYGLQSVERMNASATLDIMNATAYMEGVAQEKQIFEATQKSEDATSE